jgi:hypothetical protein
MPLVMSSRSFGKNPSRRVGNRCPFAHDDENVGVADPSDEFIIVGDMIA